MRTFLGSVWLVTSTLAISVPFNGDSYLNFDRTKPVNHDSVAFDRDQASSKLINGNINYNSQSPEFVKRQDVIMTVARDLEKRSLEKRKLKERAPLQAIEPLTDFFSGGSDSLYFGSISVGTPGQAFNMIFDSGSSDIFVPTDPAVTTQAKFKPSASSTLAVSTVPWSITYGTGSSKGYLGRDVISVAGLTVQAQIFAIANSTSSIFATLPVSGIVGMGFTSISSSGAPGFFDNLMTTGAVTNPFFGFYLQRASDLTRSSTGQIGGGSMCLGCLDSPKYTGSINYIPVSVQGYWQIPMTSISLNGNSVPGTSCQVAVDTGTSLAYFPTSVAAAFYKQLGGVPIGDTGEYSIPCSATLQSVALVFGGIAYQINLNDLFIGYASPDSKSQCVLGLLGVDQSDIAGNPVAVVGAVFLKNVYSVYTYSNGGRGPAVGFAVAVSAGSASSATSVSVPSGVASVANAPLATFSSPSIPSNTASTTGTGTARSSATSTGIFNTLSPSANSNSAIPAASTVTQSSSATKNSIFGSLSLVLAVLVMLR